MFLLPIHVPWPNQASKKLTDQQTPQLNFPSLSLPSSVCSRLDFSTFVMDFTTPEASLLLRHFAHMEPTVSIFGSYVPWTSSRWERSHQSPLRKNGAMWEVVNSKGGRFFAGEPHCLTWEKMRLGMVWCSQLRFFGSFFFFRKKSLSFFGLFLFAHLLWYRKKQAQWVFMVDGAGPLHGGLCHGFLFNFPYPKLVWPLLFSQRSKLTSHGSLKVWVALEDSDLVPKKWKGIGTT